MVRMSLIGPGHRQITMHCHMTCHMPRATVVIRLRRVMLV